MAAVGWLPVIPVTQSFQRQLRSHKLSVLAHYRKYVFECDLQHQPMIPSGKVSEFFADLRHHTIDEVGFSFAVCTAELAINGQSE